MTTESTSPTLLGRLRSPTDTAAWERFVELYTPLVYRWGRQAGFDEEETADLVQDVLLALLGSLPSFEYDPGRGRFRGWLKTIVLNRARDLLAKRRPRPVDPATLPASAEPVDPPAFWEVEYDRLVLDRARHLMRTEFDEAVWRACWEHLTSGRSAREIGAELGLSETAVFSAKARVLQRLRAELRGLLD